MKHNENIFLLATPKHRIITKGWTTIARSGRCSFVWNGVAAKEMKLKGLLKWCPSPTQFKILPTLTSL